MSSAPKTFKAEQKVDRSIDMAAFGRELAQRRADYEARYGKPCELPRNSGKRRTASKRALLEAIEAMGGKW